MSSNPLGWRERIIKVVISFTIPNILEYFLVGPLLLYRRLRYGYAFRRIILTQGKFAIVDPDDYYRLREYKWHATRRRYRCYDEFYAARRIPNRKGEKGKTIHMHREVANTPEDLLCDHINGRTLDNRKANLRSATALQNKWNSRKYSQSSSSIYKGVWFHKGIQKWTAMITVRHKRIHLGTFEDEIQAAKAYDKAAKKYYGEFAKLNFPD
jgi:hypothetical protein